MRGRQSRQQLLRRRDPGIMIVRVVLCASDIVAKINKRIERAMWVKIEIYILTVY